MMDGLSLNDAALLYCILGEPDPADGESRIYPTVEEALAYMRTGRRPEASRDLEGHSEEKEAEPVIYEQLSFM